MHSPPAADFSSLLQSIVQIKPLLCLLLYSITQSGAYDLKVEMWDANGVYAEANYADFVLGDGPDYKLYIGAYSGPAGDLVENTKLIPLEMPCDH